MAGLSYVKERNSPKSALDGWRRSVDRASLLVISLQTGNFTGKFSKSTPWDATRLRETHMLQRLLAEFPTTDIRETILENSDSTSRIRETPVETPT
ncbi:MAG: hypothetical protein G4V63_15045 [Candidatus Afipia apatlaquensis]|uniref:Uncharacterized protein n=1 Tax=Candidatus Afipia apatlaquensis TaxID=2712852 RepID=A0A7C9RGU3_9BRAD|nr:hypothetical protein [Candidatus Afipia apatlaquensis]